MQSSSAAPRPTTVHSSEITFQGLGTRWIVELLGPSTFPKKLEQLIVQAVRQFDDNYSRFKASSYIGQLNEKHVVKNPPQELLDMFDFAHKMFIATDGVFDISVAAHLQNTGYGRLNKTKKHIKTFWNETIWNRDEIHIPEGTSVDLGGFGKGWLIDKLAVLLEQMGYPHYVINGGGDIAFSAPKPIELGLEHPYDSAKVIGTTSGFTGALAVSSIVKRRWTKDSDIHHHIIDPNTKQSTKNGVVSTYVKGQTSLITDTIATVVLLRPELKEQFEKQFGVQIIVITEAQLGKRIEY